MRRWWCGRWLLVGMVLGAAHVHAQANPEWTTPIAPFHIAGNLYYVGSKDLASYLIVTPKDDVLIYGASGIRRPSGGGCAINGSRRAC
ncbi:MAG TPA: hypothetical protein VNZ02_05750 [Steroidobacteraceae bacterium]|jgi:hypothetical protein|nr:hypothetical protein [Steroidobacteraceae bacterium]